MLANNVVVLENIRSCYNVGNIIRTADALGWSVVLTGYTPSPFTQPKVKKTSLGAEESIVIQEYPSTQEAIQALHQQGFTVVAAEVTQAAVSLRDLSQKNKERTPRYAVVLGNEVVGVEAETLSSVDEVVAIPMQGEKESLNVGQTAAIFMRELQ